VAGTTVKGALFTFACGVEKQGSIVGVCVKVLGFFGFERKKRLLWGSFGGVLVVFRGLWVVEGVEDGFGYHFGGEFDVFVVAFD
jgi:hypothetical protein